VSKKKIKPSIYPVDYKPGEMVWAWRGEKPEEVKIVGVYPSYNDKDPNPRFETDIGLSLREPDGHLQCFGLHFTPDELSRDRKDLILRKIKLYQTYVDEAQNTAASFLNILKKLKEIL
jgi:hypothetical protein